MSDPLSVQLLAFNFASRTFAYTRLAQELSGPVSAFSSYKRKYLDSCIAKTNVSSTWKIDLGTGATDFQCLYSNLKVIFMYIRKSGLKLSMGKCEIGVPEIKIFRPNDFIGRNIPDKGQNR